MLPLFDVTQLASLPAFNRTHGELWMSDRERIMVIALLGHVRAETVVEIGVNEGHLAFDVLKHCHVKRYVGIDLAPWSQHRPSIKSQHLERPGERIAQLVRTHPSFELIVRERGSLDLLELPACDACIIDGDHAVEAVQHDTELATLAVRRGGVIIWHDYANATLGVTPVLDAMALGGRDVNWIKDTNLAVELR